MTPEERAAEAVDLFWRDRDDHDRVLSVIVAEIRAAVAEERASTLALLRGLEWCDVSGGVECPRCYSTKRQGHKDSCELAAKIRECEA